MPWATVSGNVYLPNEKDKDLRQNLFNRWQYVGQFPVGVVAWRVEPERALLHVDHDQGIGHGNLTRWGEVPYTARGDGSSCPPTVR